MSKKADWCVINIADGERTAQINIRGRIGSWGNTVEEIGARVEQLDVDTINVRINTLGGLAHEGVAIHNVLRAHPAKIVTVVEGIAGSAGSVVAQAGDERVMYANALTMIHGARALDEWGDEVDTPEARAAVAAWNTSLIETYQARTGKTPEELAPMLATDTWMTAREAVAAGFADRVEELHAQAASTENSALAVFAAAMEIPVEALARALAESATAAAGPADPNLESDEGGDPSTASAADPADDPASVEASTTFAAQINALAVAQGLGEHVGAWLLDGAITTVDQARAAIAEAREVRDLCNFAGVAEQAPGFIRARKPLAEVRTALINAMAEADARTHTGSHQKITPTTTSAAAPAVVAGWDAAFSKLKIARSM